MSKVVLKLSIRIQNQKGSRIPDFGLGEGVLSSQEMIVDSEIIKEENHNQLCSLQSEAEESLLSQTIDFLWEAKEENIED